MALIRINLDFSRINQDNSSEWIIASIRINQDFNHYQSRLLIKINHGFNPDQSRLQPDQLLLQFGSITTQDPINHSQILINHDCNLFQSRQQIRTNQRFNHDRSRLLIRINHGFNPDRSRHQSHSIMTSDSINIIKSESIMATILFNQDSWSESIMASIRINQNFNHDQ